MQRRDFLELALVGGAALTLPGMVRRRVLAPAAPAPVTATAPAEREARRFIDAGGGVYDVFPLRDRVDFVAPDGAVRARATAELRAPIAAAASPTGEVLVLERGHDRVHVFDAAAARRGGFGAPGSGPAELRAPGDLAVAGDAIIVADTLNHRVQLFELDGRPRARFGALGREGAALNGPTSVAVGPDGLVHVADTGNARIARFTLAGRYAGSYGRYGRGPGQLLSARCVRVDRAGTSYVLDPAAGCVHVFGADGEERSRHATERGRAAWIALTPDGRLVVSVDARRA